MTDPQSIPVSGEQHERAVEAAVRECTRLFNDDVDGNDAAKEAIDAYFASLREQGVVLVDLREVVEFVNTIVALPPALIPDVLPDAIERRFGGNEGSES